MASRREPPAGCHRSPPSPAGRRVVPCLSPHQHRAVGHLAGTLQPLPSCCLASSYALPLMKLFSPLTISWRFAGDPPHARWVLGTPHDPLAGSYRSWGTFSSTKVTTAVLEMPHGLPWHGRSKGGTRLWQVGVAGKPQGSGRAAADGGDARKGPEQHAGTAGLSLSTEGDGDAVARAGLGTPWGLDTPPTPMSALRRLPGTQNVVPGPCGFANPSTKVPMATASPGARAAHRAALLIPPS